MIRKLPWFTSKAAALSSKSNSPANSQIERARAFWIEFSKSGLFQVEWYLQAYPDLSAANVQPIQHFFEVGWREGRRPNPLFDPKWYLERYSDVAASGMNPLLHYWQYGERENRNPVSFFDTEWYRDTYKDEIGNANALAHFLSNRKSFRFSPNRHFDYAYYLQNNADVAQAGIDPLDHFINNGYREGRNPSAGFDVVFYRRSFMNDDSRDPLSHFLEVGRLAGFPTQAANAKPTQASEIRKFTSPGLEYESPNVLPPPETSRRGKIVAFYLPQFHSFPENDAWWGSGFTEWTNVSRATPRFEGHFQPRIPRDLGHYDLTSPGVLAKQVQAAKNAGIHGFCFYYYNFNGKRLLDRPVEAFLSDNSVDFPFCLMWANENWTRRWDGAEAEVLIQQDYREQDQNNLIEDIARHFRDPRYIRIDDRPLLILYRPDVVPHSKETLNQWRSRFEDAHGERPLILMVQGFGNIDPRADGFDGAIEFPPHKITSKLSPINSTLRFFDPTFSAPVFKYDDVVHASLSEPAPDFPLIKTVVPGWDNDARRQGHGLTITGSSPAKYQNWLDQALNLAKKHQFHGESFVFVNAWNEWAEGAYLEPDVHFGSAYLNATARAVAGLSTRYSRPRLLLVGHDAHRHGAQLLLLNIGKTLTEQFGYEVAFLLCEGGEMLKEYAEVGDVSVCSSAIEVRSEAAKLFEGGFGIAITNTVATGGTVADLKQAGFRVVSLIHELPKIIREKKLEQQAGLISRYSDEVVFPAESVLAAFSADIANVLGTTSVRPQGIYHQVEFDDSAYEDVRKEFNLDPSAKIVVNVGYADMRKGVDLFCRTAQLVAKADRSVTFIWVGNIDSSVEPWFRDKSAFPNVLFIGQRKDISRLLSAADVFALTSREDPFPSVVLEALSVGLPTVGFEDAGGFVDLLKSNSAPKLVPYCDVEAMASFILSELQFERTSSLRADNTPFKRQFAFDEYVHWLTSRLRPSVPKVSVLVPNYNYARYMHQRLNSIFDQTQSVFEVIVLDDASPDNSVEVIKSVADFSGRKIELIENEVNSGNPFVQWKKGLQLARGDLVWIAEADDIADLNFLRRMSQFLEDETVQFAFSDSTPIDSDGRIEAKDYKDYYSKIFPGALSKDLVVDGRAFCQEYLTQRNCILNVSSVLWRRDALQKALERTEDTLCHYRLAGDWLLYLSAAAFGGKVGYCATPLNQHRRHVRGVTSRTSVTSHLAEVQSVHRFANSVLGDDTRTIDAQKFYISELERQFNRHH